ncbi:MAG: hypothetical protein HC880_05825 [Bacteroidia bacterium]|nr:hypothetical protein [Bacteroidia bacterium]
MATGLELRTQMAPGYTFAQDADGNETRDKLLSEFFAPAFLNATLGISYQNKILKVTLSPVSNKLTFVLNDSLSQVGAFGVDPGKKVRSELGPTFTANLEWEPIKNITLISRLLLFANYETLDRIDTDWESLLVFKVNEYITTSFGTRLIYDHDILIQQDDGTSRQAVQYRQSLNINVNFKF